jgi:hypothetical protein
MIIKLNKFGSILVSRQAGKEAYAAFQPALREAAESENIEVDFDGVITFTPSWGDEFLTPLRNKYSERLTLKNTENSSVQATLKLLEEISKKTFKIQK